MDWAFESDSFISFHFRREDSFFPEQMLKIVGDSWSVVDGFLTNAGLEILELDGPSWQVMSHRVCAKFSFL